MTTKEILTAIMQEKGITQMQLATMIGAKNQTNVSMMLSRDMKVSNLTRCAEMLGYEVVLRKKKTGRKGDGVYVVDGFKGAL